MGSGSALKYLQANIAEKDEQRQVEVQSGGKEETERRIWDSKTNGKGGRSRGLHASSHVTG